MTAQLGTDLEKELNRATRESIVLGEKVKYLKTGGKFQSEERLFECLANEYNNVFTDLNIATSASNQKNDCKLYRVLGDLLDEHEVLAETIKSKKSDFALIDNELFETKKKILLARTKTLTDIEHMERIVKGRQNLRCLEYKLDIANKTYYGIVNKNNAIRKEIEVLLFERTNFNKLWFGYISNLHQGKKIMIDILEQATIAYNSREEWVLSLNSLRKLANSDFQTHTIEMDSLQKQLDDKQCIEQFIAVKNQKRFLIGLEEKNKQKSQILNCELMVKLLLYKKTLTEIKKFTKIDVEQDQKSFIDRYYSFEERNMSIFLYINDLHKDIEDLVTMTLAHKMNIEAQRQVYVQREHQQESNLDKLENKLATVTIEANVAQQKLNEIDTTLKTLFTGINQMFQLLNCNKNDFDLLLGNNITINNYNVLLFCKILEDQVDNLLLNVYLKEKIVNVPKGKTPFKPLINDKLKPRQLYKIDDIVRVSPCPLCVDALMVKNIVDTVQYISTKAEAQELLDKRLKTPDGLSSLHNVSACGLPQSHAIMQKRFY